MFFTKIFCSAMMIGDYTCLDKIIDHCENKIYELEKTENISSYDKGKLDSYNDVMQVIFDIEDDLHSFR